MKKRFIALFEILLVIFILGAHIYAALSPANSLMRWYTTDDAFYYFKTAVNIAQTGKISFDGINLSSGFHPLWMAICVPVFALYKFGAILPLRVLVLVSGLFNAASCFVLFRFLKRFLTLEIAMLAAVFWGLYPRIHAGTTQMGMESSVSAFTIILLLLLAARYLYPEKPLRHPYRQLIGISLASALVLFARLDNIFIVIMVGFWVALAPRWVPLKWVADAFVIIASGFASLVLRLGLSASFTGFTSAYWFVVVALLVKSFLFWAAGLYRLPARGRWLEKLVRIGLAVGASAVVMFAVMTILQRLGVAGVFSRLSLVFDTLLTLAGITCLRFIPGIRNGYIKSTEPRQPTAEWIKTEGKAALLRLIAYAAPVMSLLGGYMLLHKRIFGTFSPISGQIKHWWSTMPNTVYGGKVDMLQFLGLSPKPGTGPWSLVMGRFNDLATAVQKMLNWPGARIEVLLTLFFMFLFLALFLWVAFANRHPMRDGIRQLGLTALLPACLAQITYYPIVGYQHTRLWYWTAEMLCLVLVTALTLDLLVRALEHNRVPRPATRIVAGVLMVFLVWGFVRYMLILLPQHVAPARANAYVTDVRSLEKLTPPGSKIGMTGGGVVAYFIENRTIINLDGLMNSVEYFQFLKAGKANEFLDRLPLDYAYGNPYMLLESDPYHDFLKTRLEKIGPVEGGGDFVLYQYMVGR